MHAIIPHVHGVMTGFAEAISDQGRQRVVDEKPHATVTSGNSRSRTASAAY